MSDLKYDPVINAIQRGIKDDIDFNHNAERFRATILLIYAAMDAMAFLNMPASTTSPRSKLMTVCGRTSSSNDALRNLPSAAGAGKKIKSRKPAHENK